MSVAGVANANVYSWNEETVRYGTKVGGIFISMSRLQQPGERHVLQRVSVVAVT